MSRSEDLQCIKHTIHLLSVSVSVCAKAIINDFDCMDFIFVVVMRAAVVISKKNTSTFYWKMGILQQNIILISFESHCIKQMRMLAKCGRFVLIKNRFHFNHLKIAEKTLTVSLLTSTDPNKLYRIRQFTKLWTDLELDSIIHKSNRPFFYLFTFRNSIFFFFSWASDFQLTSIFLPLLTTFLSYTISTEFCLKCKNSSFWS